MTRNQIQYQQHLEDVRSHKANEAQAAAMLEEQKRLRYETERANRAREAETYRQNVATTNLNDLISQRLNATQIATNERSAKASEFAALTNAGATQYVANTNASMKGREITSNAEQKQKDRENSYLIAGLNNSTVTANAIMKDKTDRYIADLNFKGTAIGTGTKLVGDMVSSFARLVAK